MVVMVWAGGPPVEDVAQAGASPEGELRSNYYRYCIAGFMDFLNNTSYGYRGNAPPPCCTSVTSF